jgi:hypothetical protein
MALEHEALTERIIGAAIDMRRRLGPGFLESVFRQNSTGIEARDRSLNEFLPVFLPSLFTRSERPRLQEILRVESFGPDINRLEFQTTDE